MSKLTRGANAKEPTLRSELVFRARQRVANRYLLCQATAKTTRCLHFASANTTDAITDAFVRISADSFLPILVNKSKLEDSSSITRIQGCDLTLEATASLLPAASVRSFRWCSLEMAGSARRTIVRSLIPRAAAPPLSGGTAEGRTSGCHSIDLRVLR